MYVSELIVQLPHSCILPVHKLLSIEEKFKVGAGHQCRNRFICLRRHYEVPDLVRVAAPIYLKFTVRNAPGLYPSGGHIQGLVESTSRERVRRASIGVGMLKRYGLA